MYLMKSKDPGRGEQGRQWEEWHMGRSVKLAGKTICEVPVSGARAVASPQSKMRSHRRF